MENTELEKTITTREKFLENQTPKRKKYQDKINDKLKDLSDPMERMLVIVCMLNANQCKLVETTNKVLSLEYKEGL